MSYRYESYPDADERLTFATKAAAHLSRHPEHDSYSEGDEGPQPGGLLAVRWNRDPLAVLVVRLPRI